MFYTVLLILLFFIAIIAVNKLIKYTKEDRNIYDKRSNNRRFRT